MTPVHDQQIQPASRREYVAPQLVHYGSVSDLTAGGSANHGESNPGKGDNRFNRP